MIQFSIFRTRNGNYGLTRKVDAINDPGRDMNYDLVDLAPFENDTLGEAALTGKLTQDQIDLITQLALPLFPELSNETSEGEEWKR